MIKYRGLRVLGNFINGEFKIPSDVSGEWVSRSPADLNDEFGRFQYSYRSVEDAVKCARDAFSAWKKTPVSTRAEILKKLQGALARRKEEIAEVIAREAGKPQWEAAAEVGAMIENIGVVLEHSLPVVGDYDIPNGACRHRPLGVAAVVGSFNYPGDLPNGHILPALLTGNTVVFKPSEKSPMAGQLLAECFSETGLPPGVFNLVQGEKELSRRLCVHDGVDAGLFTGSYEVGTRIKQDTLQQHWKLLVLQMGGKNPAIVWKDADLNLAIRETLTGAFITGGQRCTSTSRVIIDNSLLEEFVERFHEKAKAFSIDNPLKNPFMGPLIDQTSVDRYMKFFGIAAREGSEIIMRGKILELDVSGNYVTPSICVVNDPSVDKANKSVYQQTEVIGPNIAVIGVDDLDHAVALANASQYGLVSSVFTKDQEIFQKCFNELEFGLVNWNESTITTSMRLPYMGLKKSGNHRPGELLAPLYCQQPVSTVQRKDTNVFEEYPGLNWKK